MFPRYETIEPNDRDPSADPLALHQREQGYTLVPGEAPVGYVRDYDDGRPTH
jgi:hypothetical protein